MMVVEENILKYRRVLCIKIAQEFIYFDNKIFNFKNCHNFQVKFFPMNFYFISISISMREI
jgi:hypothetical protein